MSNVLIAYFSRAGNNYVNGRVEPLEVGNTEVVAMMISQETGGDLFRIDSVEPYPDDYHACTDQAAAEKRAGARPALRALPEDMGGYDTVLLGYPNWWGTMPMPVYTFLESVDLAGKTILPFCTHEGSGLSGTEREIAHACPGATVGRGLAVHGADVRRAHDAVTDWVRRSLPARG